jgi:uncharacterized protein (UPF0212 family)
VTKLTNCKTCNKEISKTAKICPHCGEKLKAGLLKKIITGFVLVFILLIVIGIFAEKSEHNSAQQASSQSSDEEVKKPVVTYTIQQLNAMYEENEVKTDEELKGQTIIITGTVQEISKDFTDGIALSLVSENKYLPSSTVIH